MIQNVLSKTSNLLSKGSTPKPCVMISLEFEKEFQGSRSFEGKLSKAISAEKRHPGSKKVLRFVNLLIECGDLSGLFFSCSRREYERGKGGRYFTVLAQDEDGAVHIARARVSISSLR